VIPNLESQIGITIYSTDFTGIGGKIRVEPEDFQVSEIISQRAQKLLLLNNLFALEIKEKQLKIFQLKNILLKK
jgi:tRNA pseudouridine13 synthase